MWNDKLDVIEVFGGEGKWALQGEGMFTGVPSTFIRTFGCNLACKFGLTDDPMLAESYERQIRSYPTHFPNKTLEELPVYDKFCDTYYSIFPEYAKYAKTYSVDELTDYVYSLCKDYNDRAHLIFTGGEPLLPLNQEFYIKFLQAVHTKCNVKHVSFETNTTQALIPDFEDSSFVPKISFSMSPKLSSAGYSIAENCYPDVVWQYIEFSKKHEGHSWFKFVVSKKSDIDEIFEYLKHAYVENKIPVYLMPAGGTKKELDYHSELVYDLCAKYGFRFSSRLQVSVKDNGIGI